MIIAPIGKTRSTRNRGAAYILAITTMLVGMTLALAALRASSGCFLSEDSRCKKQAAQNLAEAGVDYAFWQVHYNGAQLPFSADVTLDTGIFHVEAVDDGNRDRSTMRITSTGTYRGVSKKIVRVALGLLPYDYAWCENSDVSDWDAINISGSGKGMRANGSIYLYNTASSISGGWATSTISGPVSPKYANSPSILFPDVDYNSLQSAATVVYYGYVTLTSANLQLASGGALIYVIGNVSIQGDYVGTYTVVSTGEVVISGDLKRKISTDTNSAMGIIAGNKIQLNSGAHTVQAILYAHTSGNYGQVNIVGGQTVVGSIAGDDFITNGPVQASIDPKITLSKLRQLHMPGL